MIKKIDYDNVLMICSNLNTYISAGIPMIKALELVGQSLNNKVYIESLDRIIIGVKKGETLSEAIKQEGKLYPDIFGDMISIGEESGNIEKVLERLGGHFKRNREVAKRVKKIMIYPTFLITIMVLVIFIYMIFILPSFRSLYNDIEGTPNKIVSLVIKYLDFIEGNPYAFVIMFCYAICFGLIGYIILDYFRKKEFLSNNKLVKMYYEANLISILGLVISSGIAINSCIDKLSESLESKELKKYMRELKYKLWNGESLSESISSLNIMSPLSVSFIFSGEEAGKLENNINILSNILENDFSEKVNIVVGVIEPVLISFLGVIVIVMVLLVFVPIYGYMGYV